MALCELIKACDICQCSQGMRDNLLRYQIVNRVQDGILKEKLLQGRTLTPAKCIDRCRAAGSATKQAQQMADSASHSEVNRITSKHTASNPQIRSATTDTALQAGQHRRNQCKFCGRFHPLSSGSLPSPATAGAISTMASIILLSDALASMVIRQVSTRLATQAAGVSETTQVNQASNEYIAMTNAIGPSQGSGTPYCNRAKLRVHGRDKTFLLDTSSSTNLISTHDVDVGRLTIKTPKRLLVLWNGSNQRSVGNAVTTLYNPS